MFDVFSKLALGTASAVALTLWMAYDRLVDEPAAKRPRK